MTIRFEKGEIAYDIILVMYSKYIHGTLKTIIRNILIKFVISNKDFEGDKILDRIKQGR